MVSTQYASDSHLSSKGVMGAIIKNMLVFSVAVGGAVAATSAVAQNYPTKPVRIISGSVGSGGDLIARYLGQRLTERWGTQVVVDNRNAIIGSETVARAPADGYTLMMGQLTSHATAPSIYKSLAYDPVKDFAPITLATHTPLLLMAHPSVPGNNLREFLDSARKQPGVIQYAAQSGVSNSRLTMVLFCRAADLDMLYVPYKGPAASLTALLGREAQVSFLVVSLGLPHLGAGRLKAYAITSKTRFSTTRDVPTMAEAGLPGVESSSWYGLFAPAKIERPLLAKLNRDMVAVLKSPEAQAAMLAQGAEVAAGTPEEFAAFVKSEVVKWGSVIKAAGIKPE